MPDRAYAPAQSEPHGTPTHDPSTQTDPRAPTAHMNAERDRPDYPLKATARVSWGSAVPSWYLRLRLRWAEAGIARLQQLLEREFGLEETAPLHRELEALVAERDALAKRLAAQLP